jgi:glucose-6-phosphate-specific signal transduction histidine kinase
MHLSRSMIDRLRKVDPAAAMELTYTAALEARTFHGQILEAMYPLKLESEGLYTVLRSSAMIAALEETGIQIKWRLLGNASNLSSDLKRMVYRAVIEIVDTFSKAEPTTINVYVRCGSIRMRQGGAIVLQAEGVSAGADTEPTSLAALQHRVNIYGGSMRQHREKVTVLLSERAYVRAARAA